VGFLDKSERAAQGLPDSSVQVPALIVVALLAGMAALARVLYGREELSWRYTVASVFVAMVVGLMTYGLMANFAEIGGYLTVAIGIATGLFTDDFLKRSRVYFDKPPGAPHGPV